MNQLMAYAELLPGADKCTIISHRYNPGDFRPGSGPGSGRTYRAIIKAKSQVLQGKPVLLVMRNWSACSEIQQRHFPRHQGWDKDVQIRSLGMLMRGGLGMRAVKVILDHACWMDITFTGVPGLHDGADVYTAIGHLERGL